MKLAANKRCTFTNHKPRRFSHFLCCDETPSLCDFARGNIYCLFQFGCFLPRVSGFQSLLVLDWEKKSQTGSLNYMEKLSVPHRSWDCLPFTSTFLFCSAILVVLLQVQRRCACLSGLVCAGAVFTVHISCLNCVACKHVCTQSFL